MNLPVDDNLTTKEHTKNDTSCEYTNTLTSGNGLSSKKEFECSNSLFANLQSPKLFDSFTEKTGDYNSDSTDVFVKSNVEINDPSSFLPRFYTNSPPTQNSVHANNSFLNDVEAKKQLSSGVMTSQNNLESKSATLETSGSINLPDNEPETAIILECQKINWIYSSPKVIACADSEFRLSEKLPSHDNYLRGCLWSPDGSCILTNSHDNILRLFNLPSSILTNEGGEFTLSEPEEMKSVLRMHEKELIYDYGWYPLMCSDDPVSCCFASTSRRNPIRLWDAFSGIIRATYTPINHLGEVVSASSLSFSFNGLRLYAGFHRYIQVFDVSRPGSDSIRRPKLGKKPIQGGIISCIGVLNDPSRNIYATGSYNGTVCIFSEPGNLITRLFSHQSGVTQVTLTKTFAGKSGGAPWYVLVGGRMDSRIFVWDARYLINPITIIHRRIENHQKFQFDVEPTGRYLFTGSQTGVVCAYDLPQCITEVSENGQTCPSSHWRAHYDSTNGVSIHPSLPIIATSSGQRRIRQPTLKHPFKKQRTAEMLEVQQSISNVTIPRHQSTLSNSDSESNSSSCDEKFLSDGEASMMITPVLVTGSTVSSGESDVNPMVEEFPLPLKGKLTLLPRENRLNLWSFPLSVTT
ncbi:Telomerase Cajal body protein 1 [Schistosoma japonicum]|nr:Telomerase Cajal body protein 1 [Schistosoma japonicum]